MNKSFYRVILLIYLFHRYFNIPMDILPKILSSSEIYGQLADGPLKGIPISGVSIFLSINSMNLI